jgi:sigma-E processing peptidase SpoIIGA
VIFIYIFYLDVFFGQNFLMNLIILSLTNLFCKSTVRLLLFRRCAAALCGAACEAVLFLVLPYRLLFVAAGAFFTVPLMILLAFGFGGGRSFGQRLAISWLSTVLLNGVVSAVYGLTGIRTLPVYVAVLSFFPARFFVRMLAGSVKRQRRLFSLTLCGNGKSVRCMGLYDSGCLLTMPLSGEPVHIIAPQLLQKLFGEESGRMQTIPYRALGTDSGQIAVCRLDQMRIQQKKGTKILEHPWVGSAQEALLRDKPYQVILHAGVIDNV